MGKSGDGVRDETSVIGAQVSDKPVTDRSNEQIAQIGEETEPESSVAVKPITEQADSGGMTTVGDGARHWFASLSVEDQVLALSFVDYDFLATLARAATKSLPSLEGGSPTTDGHTSKVGWMTAIPLVNDGSTTIGTPGHDSDTIRIGDQDVEKPVSLATQVEEGNETVTDSAKMKVAEVDEMNCADPESLIGGGEAADGRKMLTSDTATEEPDSFRIGEDRAGKLLEESASSTEHVGAAKEKDEEYGDETPALPVEDTPWTVEEASMDTKRQEQILSFTNSVCVVFPSAFQLVGSDPASGNVPIVSLQPSYFSNRSSEQALLAFDEMMFSGKFLSSPTCGSWDDAVKALARAGVDSPASSSPPLYMLLLMRFQLSVMESYRATFSTNVENEKHFAQASTDVKMSKTDSLDQSSVVDGSAAPVASPAQHVEANASVTGSSNPAILFQDGRSKTAERLVPDVSGVTNANASTVMLLRSLFECPGLDANKDEDEAILLDFVSLLNNSVAGEDSDFDSRLNMINADVAHRIRSLKGNGNAAIEVSEQTSSQNARVGHTAEHSHISVEGTAGPSSVIAAESQDNGAGATGKKNSKRRKKKKRRRGTGAAPKNEAVEDHSTNVGKDLQPAVEKTESATQTETPCIEQVQERLASASIDLPASASTKEVSTVSVHCAKWREDDSDDSVEDLIEAQKDNGQSKVDDEESDEGLQISRLDGVGTVVVTPSVAREGREAINSGKGVSDAGLQSAQLQPQPAEEDIDEWETVEVRSRNNRKKGGDKGNSGRTYSTPTQNGHGSKRNKTPRNGETRRRIAKRKMAREILSSVLDAVDDQVTKKKQAATASSTSGPSSLPVHNAWGLASKTKKPSIMAGETADVRKAQHSSSQKKEGVTMRDILMGKKNGSTASAAKTFNPQHSAQRGYADRVRQKVQAESVKKSRERPKLISPTADQNTAPTLPETISAVSTVSAVTETPSATKHVLQAPEVSRSESSSSESVEATKPQSNSKQLSKEISPSPPLPTLLSPGNANSATSSVASSLDAPHVVHHNHHAPSPGNENDVGYHLLRVCDKLTRDIGQFMKRRELALSVRRMERGLVLGALQETLSDIWPAGCKVEMYGSCATDLDLPSSDLDVVVRGLDQAELTAMQVGPQMLSDSRSDSEREENTTATDDAESIEYSKRGQHSPLKASAAPIQYPMIYPHLTSNAERVVTLAMELERQAWAVHVKAIPTATVPVIKILADPARLQGAPASNNEWLVHQPHATQSPTFNGADTSDPTNHYPGSTAHIPWRGADVVNGLLKVDITFEGPEHGGIGSTKFSSRVVEEFSKESGLPPESTPAVQVLMVLKELLAQRRLNEPFSGGLSSYALLLLVVSVIRERGIITRELERVERQRRLVAAGGGNSIPGEDLDDNHDSPTLHSSNTIRRPEPLQWMGYQSDKPKAMNQNGSYFVGDASASIPQPAIKTDATKEGLSPVVDPKAKEFGIEASDFKRGGSGSSSWALIARKNAGAPSHKDQESVQNSSHLLAPPKRMGSFADAVSKGPSTQSIPSVSQSLSAKKSDSKSQVARSSEEDAIKVNSDANAQSIFELGKQSSLPVNAAPYEPSNTQSYHGSLPPRHNTTADDSLSFFPQSFHDVIEVLCSGETTPGKLLMHFLLFYGQHFDSHSTAIDYSNTHDRDPNANNGYAVSSPYLHRGNTGSYDPMTGMLTVDPIVVYDPLKGSEANNVARSCFAWSSIRWVFAQSYMTLSSAVEMSAGHMSGQDNGRGGGAAEQNDYNPGSLQDAAWGGTYGHDETGNVMFDPSSPLLELLLAF